MTAGHTVEVDQLSDDQLAAALVAGIIGADWPEQAAVELLVANRAWLGRFELRQAVEVAVLDGEVCAWVAWPYVDLDAPASSGELRILTIARSLGGVASERSLGDLLTSLDCINTGRVLDAVAIACQGRDHDHQRRWWGGGVMTGAPAPKLHVPVPVWLPILSWGAVLGAVALLGWMVRGWWRRQHRPKITDTEASRRRWVTWVSSRWIWDASNLGLVLVDDTTRHRREWWTGRALPPLTRVPQIRFETAPCGLRAWMHTLPGVGLDQVTKMAGHLANAWGCLRVDVAQHAPGLLLLRGFVYDPLAQPWSVTPTGEPLTDWRLHVGIDDEANHVVLSLANLSGVTVAGVPGTGKTSLQRWWLCQLAPHPATQIAVLDGKVSDPADGDYGQLLARCFAASGDDLADANRLLERLWQAMRARSAWLRSKSGHRPVLGCRPHCRLPARHGDRG